MSGLTDCVDRLSMLAAAIRANAFSTGRLSEDGPQPLTSSAGPFTRAVLDAPLGDLIRDIDPSELGLFTLVQPPTRSASQTAQEDSHAQKAEIVRVALPIATPLRRPPAATQPRREDNQRHGEYDPEVYTNAAIKFLGRYQSIRHMPRYLEEAEMILERLAAVRKSVSSLNEKLKQASSRSSDETHVSPKAKISEEERRIQEAEVQILELRRRKEVLLHKQKRAQSKSTAGQKSQSRSHSPPSRPDAQEESFWNTPGTAARTLHFNDDLLTDEQMNMGDISAFASPILEQIPNRTALRHIPRAVSSKGKTLQFTRKAHDGDSADVDAPKKKLTSPPTGSAAADEDEDVTAMLDKSLVSHSTSDVRTQSPPLVGPAQVSHAPTESAPAAVRVTEHLDAPRAPSGDRKTKLKVTADVERIVEKIWATVGDLVMPGHIFDVSGTGSGSKPPHAKDTISHLRSIASLTPSLASPSASSISYSTLSTVPPSASGPTPQQILTAQALLAMLASPPSYSMPLNKLKEILSASGVQGSAVTRPIYGCVAKRLLKIERGGGEQVVKFDV